MVYMWLIILGYTTREEFIRDAARWRLELFRENTEYVEVPRDKYEKLGAALEEMDVPYLSVADFIDKQIDEVLAEYESLLEEIENREKAKGEIMIVVGDGKFF
ncbi:MAG: hypothetical protein ACQXXL_07760 [Candidatus Methanosuratincola sp.]|jgi:hypothetical protein